MQRDGWKSTEVCILRQLQAIFHQGTVGQMLAGMNMRICPNWPNRRNLVRPGAIKSHLFYKFRFKTHRTETINFAVDIMVAVYQTDIFYFGSHLEGSTRAF